MTAKILTGTYTAGCTLSAGYFSLTIASSGLLEGAVGPAGANSAGNSDAGGASLGGVSVPTFAPVVNLGTVVGGGARADGGNRAAAPVVPMAGTASV